MSTLTSLQFVAKYNTQLTMLLQALPIINMEAQGLPMVSETENMDTEVVLYDPCVQTISETQITITGNSLECGAGYHFSMVFNLSDGSLSTYEITGQGYLPKSYRGDKYEIHEMFSKCRLWGFYDIEEIIEIFE